MRFGFNPALSALSGPGKPEPPTSGPLFEDLTVNLGSVDEFRKKFGEKTVAVKDVPNMTPHMKA